MTFVTGARLRSLTSAFAWLMPAIAAGVFAYGAPALAEPVGSHLQFTPFGGYAVFGDHVRFAGSNRVNSDFHVGGRLGYKINDWFGVEGAAGYTPTSETLGPTTQGDVDFMHGSLGAMFTPFSGSWGTPFLALSAGGVQFNRDTDKSRFRTVDGEVAVGLLLWLGDVVGLRLEARELLWQTDDVFANPDQTTTTTLMGAGLTFAIGATPRDTDADGVPDKSDACADTPAGAKVDARGCPLDGDNDKVFDGLDRCPDTPLGATVDAGGCPTDGDQDGVWDGIDRCADTPAGARVDPTGCPIDADQDGIPDGIDRCTDTPRGATVDATGCPSDADRDSVWDGLDKCPDTSPGLRVDKDGCPIEVTERETELMDTGMIRMQDVRFETGKADLMPESQQSLDAIGQVLVQWPDLRIEIGGHTDSRGSTAFNQKLSETRVNSVLAYLVRKFPAMKREQFTTKGYGESKPLVPNTNAENMSKNRRVEFTVLNREVLRRETERRKLLRNP